MRITGRCSSKEDVELCDIVLPSDLHYEVSRAVLESGRHLLLEKPMALSIAHCRELIELARARGRVLAVGHELRLSSLWGKVKELVDAGAIGEPLYALIELWRRPYRLGSGGWRYDIRRVGSWILEEPIHFFDLARWYLSSAGDPVSVYARANGKRADHPELHDNFSAIVNFPARPVRRDLADAGRMGAPSDREADRDRRGALGVVERRHGSDVRADVQSQAADQVTRWPTCRSTSRQAKCTSWSTRSRPWCVRSARERPCLVRARTGCGRSPCA